MRDLIENDIDGFNKVIIEYTKNNKNRPVGCLIARKTDGIIYIGWSKFAVNKEEVDFSKKLALKIASDRMNSRIDRDTAIKKHMIAINELDGVEDICVTEIPTRALYEYPFLIQEKLEGFMERCRRYFRVDAFIVT